MASTIRTFYSKPLPQSKTNESPSRERYEQDKLPLQTAEYLDFAIVDLTSPLKSYILEPTLEEKVSLSLHLHDSYDDLEPTSAEGMRSLNPSEITDILDAEESSSTYREALEKWNAVQVALSQHKPKSIKKSWSLSRKNTYKILKEWWNNAAYDSSVTSEIREWIEQAASLGISTRILPRITLSRYNLRLLLLWVMELGNQSRLGAPNARRATAGCEAATHRLVACTMESFCSETPELHANPPHYTQDEGSQWSQPAAIDPCFWIDQEQLSKDEVGSPYFLWDVLEKKTIRHQDIVGARYTAISHTWGRWKTGSHFHTSAVPWPVPENSLFDVSALPDILQDANLHTRYVWLDLLCIPQELASPDMKERGRIEIASQAAIFRSATRCGAWLNFVPCWDGLESALTWLSLVYAECEGFSNEKADRYITSAIDEDQLTTHLVGLEDAAYILKGWFTSLWTLQEICLRPDMMLYDRSWRPLSLGSFHVPFDHICCLGRLLLTASFGDEPRWTAAVRELYFVLIETGMQDLPTMSPTSVLLYGNQRYCESRRAEAIMSVIGSTDWFSEESGSEIELMAGRYPYAFVDEARDKLGATFFAWADTDYEEVSADATMLPFSGHSFAGRRAYGNVFEPMDHPSVSTWKVRPNGEVYLPQAGIVASSTRERTGPRMAVSAHIPFGSPLAPKTYSSEPEIDLFLKSAAPEKERHAIALLRAGNERLIGLLLEMERPGYCRKIGTFEYFIESKTNVDYREGRPYEFPASEEVNWIVV